MADEAKTVTIWCRVPNGIDLILFKQGYDDGTGTGYRPILAGQRVTLKGPKLLAHGLTDRGFRTQGDAVENQVDADFWAKWKEQNVGRSPIFDQGMIFETGVVEKVPSE